MQAFQPYDGLLWRMQGSLYTIITSIVVSQQICSSQTTPEPISVVIYEKLKLQRRAQYTRLKPVLHW